MAEGKFIVFEGIDGSGISTQAELFRLWLEKKGIEHHLTKEPSEGPVGAIIRLAIAKRLVYVDRASPVEGINPVTLALLFAADRVDHLQTDILSKLAIGVTVICDRYYLSSYAYQGIDVDLEWLQTVNRFARRPDLIVLIDTPAELSSRRMARNRWRVDLFEDVKKLEEVRQRFLTIAGRPEMAGERIEIVDGSGSPQSVHREVVRIARPLWNRGVRPPAPQLSLTDALQAEHEGSNT